MPEEKEYVIYSSIIINAKTKQEARRKLRKELKKYKTGEYSCTIDHFLGETEIELEENYF